MIYQTYDEYHSQTVSLEVSFGILIKVWLKVNLLHKYLYPLVFMTKWESYPENPWCAHPRFWGASLGRISNVCQHLSHTKGEIRSQKWKSESTVTKAENKYFSFLKVEFPNKFEMFQNYVAIVFGIINELQAVWLYFLFRLIDDPRSLVSVMVQCDCALTSSTGRRGYWCPNLCSGRTKKISSKEFRCVN